jgi:hypothetical protein
MEIIMSDNEATQPSPYAPHEANRVKVRIGDKVRVQAPYSEVCMSMRVAGTVMDVEVVAREFDTFVSVSAQLWTLDGKRFSAPITLGEAGIYGTMADGMYAYGVIQAPSCPFVDSEECAMARERSVAGVSNDVPACPVHDLGFVGQAGNGPRMRPTEGRSMELSWHQQRAASMHALPDDIVGYTFNAETYCPGHIIDALPTGEGGAFEGWALAAGIHMSVEDNLDEVAASFVINRADESSFDDGEFPKVILRSMAHATDDGDRCRQCGDILGE